MQIIKFSENQRENWENFCLKSNDAWFWHTARWIKYILSHQSESEALDLSFFIEENNQIKAIVPLISANVKQEGKIYREFSFSGWANPTPAIDNSLSEIEREIIFNAILGEIDRLAQKEKASFVRFVNAPLSINSLNNEVFLPVFDKFNYVDLSVYSQIINLGKTENELWNNLRRNHRRLIKNNSQIKILFFDSKNITPEIFKKYEEMHFLSAGRKTRPHLTFDFMYGWIKNNLGFLTAAELDKKYVGFEYFLTYKNNAFASSIATDSSCENQSIRHLMEWKSILWMKEQGLSFFEIGYQPYSSPTDKQLNISHFKKGFGGLIVPMFMKEKKYNHE